MSITAGFTLETLRELATQLRCTSSRLWVQLPPTAVEFPERLATVQYPNRMIVQSDVVPGLLRFDVVAPKKPASFYTIVTTTRKSTCAIFRYEVAPEPDE